MNSIAIEEKLHALESRVESVLALCERLQTENRSLREQQNDLVAERSRLLEKNDLARHKVEQMIDRLKALEESH